MNKQLVKNKKRKIPIESRKKDIFLAIRTIRGRALLVMKMRRTVKRINKMKSKKIRMKRRIYLL